MAKKCHISAPLPLNSRHELQDEAGHADACRRVVADHVVYLGHLVDHGHPQDTDVQD